MCKSANPIITWVQNLKSLLFILFVFCLGGLSAIPFTMGFEGTFPPSSWTLVNGGSTNTWTKSSYGDFYHTGIYSAKYANATADDDWLITPPLAPTTGDVTISFWALTTELNNSISVKLSTSTTASTAFYTTLATITPSTTNTWAQYTYNLSAYIGQYVYIGIHTSLINSGAVYLDDFSCPAKVDVDFSIPFQETFGVSSFPPSDWAVTTPASPWVRSDLNAYGATGSGCAMANFYSYGAGTALDLLSPSFFLAGQPGWLSFDYAYATFMTEVDQLEILYSTNYGTSFSSLVVYTGGASGTMVTSPPQSDAFFPNASQWASKTIALPAGTNKIKFHGISAYGNNLFIDNIRVDLGFANGSGTSGNPFQITSAAELNNLRYYLGLAHSNKYFKLMNDIDLSSYLAEGGAGYTAWGAAGWLPIGTTASTFYGNFDGNYHTISGLKIERSGLLDCGLWGNTYAGSTIQNLTVQTASESWVRGSTSVGILAGYNGGTITNCSVSGSIRGNGNIGGLIGWNNGTVYRCKSTGDIISTGDASGGLIGKNFSSIYDSYSRCSVSGTTNVGGLVGYRNSGSITNCYATGLLAGTTKGGLCLGTGGTVTTSFWDTQTTGMATSNGGTGKTTAQMQQQSTYTGWDFVVETTNGNNNYWSIASADNSGYPFLCWEKHNVPSHPYQTYPINAATVLPQHGFNLTWSMYSGQQSPSSYNLYMIEGSPTHIFETGYTGQHTFTNITTTSYNPVTQGGVVLEYNKTWYWAVAACYGGVELTPLPDVHNFTTESEIVFTEGFETGNTDGSSSLANWSQVIDSGSNMWRANSFATSYNRAPRTGNWDVYLTAPGYCWLFLPVLLYAGQPYQLELYARQYLSNPPYAQLGVFFGTSATIAAMTNTIVANTGLGNTEYNQLSGTFIAPSTTTYYIGIKGYVTWNIPNYITLDDITLKHTPLIPPDPATQISPANLATNQSLLPTLTWNQIVSDGGYPTSYKIYLEDSDTPIDPSILIATDSASPYTLTTGLEYNTTYYWKVVASNSYGDAVGSTVRSFTTSAGPVDENFSGSFPPANWTRYSGELDWVTTLSPNSQWVWNNWCNLMTPVNGSARMTISNAGNFGWLLTPPIRMGVAGSKLELDIALTDNGNSNAITTDPNGTTGIDDRFVILIGDGTAWSPANIWREWNNTGSTYVYNDIPSTGLHLSIPLDGYTGTKYVAFYGSSSIANASNDLFVDNVRYALMAAPSNLVIQTGSVPGTITLNWDDTGADWYGIYSGTTPDNLVYLGSSETNSFTITTGNRGFFKVTSGSGTPPRFEDMLPFNLSNRSKEGISSH